MNGVLRRLFAPERDVVKGDWKKLHNEERNNLYCSPDIVQVIKSRRTRWAGQVARVGERKGAYKVWWGKPSGKNPLRRPRCRWENNINIDL